jgi:hypothetical protein
MPLSEATSHSAFHLSLSIYRYLLELFLARSQPAGRRSPSVPTPQSDAQVTLHGPVTVDVCLGLGE